VAQTESGPFSGKGRWLCDRPLKEEGSTLEVFKRPLDQVTVILVTQEAEIRRIMVQSQPWQVIHKPLFQKISSQK
jgi:hypothetical protein